jgi:hypothetical protein
MLPHKYASRSYNQYSPRRANDAAAKSPVEDSQLGQSLFAQPIWVALASASNFDDVFRN